MLYVGYISINLVGSQSKRGQWNSWEEQIRQTTRSGTQQGLCKMWLVPKAAGKPTDTEATLKSVRGSGELAGWLEAELTGVANTQMFVTRGVRSRADADGLNAEASASDDTRDGSGWD